MTTDVEARVALLAQTAVAALTPERRSELQLLSQIEPGLRLRKSAEHPDWAELLWAGQVVGMASFRWLADGDDTRPDVTPDGYNGP